ncbi:transcription-repair coupling factor [Chloracidobacterium aggregatum]|uniref:transcription-repair coupling factor n=1 Tax=Chloracidobacterium aggregatum TaxID=2851959 RepID=UPI001B8D4878|nr:transcription-repair coupling factor [Chloracidobacterium aggregatum]QUV88146.1 transcription-repair coupling factor [Chloracidobacterium sp. S]QUV91067.1 transcription-repair coupling factor [Chloracidobacterium sp. A]QUV97454.1 transcription-repair coupling factor [Chloracidobacterium sp. E]
MSTATPQLVLPAPFSDLARTPEGSELLRQLRQTRPVSVVSGVTGSARALIPALLHAVTGQPVVFVVPTPQDGELLEADVRYFVRLTQRLAADSPDGVQVFPVVEGGPYCATSPHPDVLEARALCLNRLLQGESRVTLVPARALAERLAPPQALTVGRVTLEVGEEYPLDDLLKLLSGTGYVRREPVMAPGEFSLRGGILDIYSPAQDNPVRLEFWGDTLESIREFDIESQRSIARRTSCQVLPLREFATLPEGLRAWAARAREHWAEARFADELRPRLTLAERGELFDGWESLLPLAHPLTGSLFDYLGAVRFVIEEPAAVERSLEKYARQLHDQFTAANDAGELVLAPDYFLLDAEALRTALARYPRCELRALGITADRVDAGFMGELTPREPSDNGAAAAGAPWFLFPPPEDAAELALATPPMRRFHGRMSQLVTELRELRQRGVTTLFVMPSSGVAERVRDMLREYDIAVGCYPDLLTLCQALAETQRASCFVTVGSLLNGFRFPAAQLAFVVERELFDEAPSVEEVRLTPAGSPKRKVSVSSFLSDFRDLKVGDFVVHVNHGIGRFLGLQQVQVDHRTPPCEVMVLEYADQQRLSVPVERLDLVQKFSSAETSTPRLDRLGGNAWAKTKARAKRAMRDMTEELLRLYAERQLVQGAACAPDTPWQQEFEDAFPYELTRDQATALTDIKRDLESPVPMDRLLCGDVGFGKTEVAMRAAFKVVMENRQVAVLSPTTVLAFQHTKTFRERFASFPVTIEMVSRFRTAKEIADVLARTARGEVDILIGTHRLLSKDVTFKHLGLVIIDEEQRFGVAHKEKLKQLRRKVDVLTLSATPIPRTLNLAIAGLRDMSVIETPPRDRLPIHTVVAQFSENVVRSAIETELARGGQVFFVHNRVESIFTIAELIQRLAPAARIGVGHGQMGEKELEAVMMRFVNHELDVLVSTTIIENGIDIPLANTIVINHADQYGLAQLYQLRGRVGRSNRRAFAYLLIPPETELSSVARQRLAAIREFSDLGSGFRIAALDLELRGAGNLLGGQQSGHLDTIGFDLYCRLLDETVRELRGMPIEEDIQTAINLRMDIRIPETYIADVGQRLRTYKRISSAADDAALEALGQELDDRYGPRPPQVIALFEYARLRHRASALGILSLDWDGGTLSVRFADKPHIDVAALTRLVAEVPGARLTGGQMLRLPLAAAEPADVFAVIHRWLERLTPEETQG